MQDIAGLVKTIYETLGQSVRVPHYGSKTIEVKLMISPEKKVCKKSVEVSSPTLPKTHELSGDTPNKNKWSNDFHSSKTRDQRKYRQERSFCRRRHSISSSGLSEDREADVSEDDDEVPLNNKYVNSVFLYVFFSFFARCFINWCALNVFNCRIRALSSLYSLCGISSLQVT